KVHPHHFPEPQGHPLHRPCTVADRILQGLRLGLRHDLWRARLLHTGDGHVDVRQCLPVLQRRLRDCDRRRHHPRGHCGRHPLRPFTGEELMSIDTAEAQPSRPTSSPDSVSVPSTPKKRSRSHPAVTIAAVIGALIWITPLVLLLVSAVRPLSDFLSNGPVSWPSEFTLANFPEAWEAGQFGTAYLNSTFLLLVKVPLGVLLAALLAYALAKLEFPFRNTILFTVVLGMTIPIYIAIVPLFTMLREVGMTDS